MGTHGGAGRTIGKDEIGMVAQALVLASKGARLSAEAKRQLRVVVTSAGAVDAVRREAGRAEPDERIEVREAALEVARSARALDMLLGAHALLGHQGAREARSHVFPDGLGVRGRGMLKVGRLQLVAERIGQRAAALAEIGAEPFVEAFARALCTYEQRVAASAAKAPPKPVRVAELVAEANRAVRRYAEIVRAQAVLAEDGSDEPLLAPLAHRATKGTASEAIAAGDDGAHGEEIAPPSRAA